MPGQAEVGYPYCMTPFMMWVCHDARAHNACGDCRLDLQGQGGLARGCIPTVWWNQLCSAWLDIS
jgi:hypothetical protein